MKKLITIILLSLLISGCVEMNPPVNRESSEPNTCIATLSLTHFDLIETYYQQYQIDEIPEITIEHLYLQEGGIIAVSFSYVPPVLELDDCFEIVDDLVFLYQQTNRIVVFSDLSFHTLSELKLPHNTLKKIRDAHSKIEPLEQLALASDITAIRSLFSFEIAITWIGDISNDTYLYRYRYNDDEIICIEPIMYYEEIVDEVVLTSGDSYTLVYYQQQNYRLEEARELNLIDRDHLLLVGEDLYQKLKSDYQVFHQTTETVNVQVISIFQYTCAVMIGFTNAVYAEVIVQIKVGEYYFEFPNSNTLKIWHLGTFFELREAYEHQLISDEEVKIIYQDYYGEISPDINPI